MFQSHQSRAGHITYDAATYVHSLLFYFQNHYRCYNHVKHTLPGPFCILVLREVSESTGKLVLRQLLAVINLQNTFFKDFTRFTTYKERIFYLLSLLDLYYLSVSFEVYSFPMWKTIFRLQDVFEDAYFCMVFEYVCFNFHN